MRERGRRLADERDLRADVAPDARRRAPDLLDRRTARRLGVEVVLEDARVELLQQDLERGLQVRDLDLRVARMAQQIDEERDAGAVAVIDAARIDDHAPGWHVGHRAAHRRPTSPVTDARIEPARQRQHAAPIRGSDDREGRGRS